MSRRLRVALLVCVMSVIELAVGTAPGDEEPQCPMLRSLGAAPTPNYAPNMRILMDSWNYKNLLPATRSGAVWDAVDNDDNNPSGATSSVSSQ